MLTTIQKNRSTYINLVQGSLQSKESYQRLRRALYNDKGVNSSEDITFLQVYVPNNRASNYVRQIPLKLQGETDEPTVTLGDFNTSLRNRQIQQAENQLGHS